MNDSDWLHRMATDCRRVCAGEPRLVIDLDRLEANCDWVRARLPSGRAVRLVQKSLPSLPLLRHVAARIGTSRLMVFHRPFLNYYAVHWPDCDVLLGKPMPVEAAATFYRELAHVDTRFDPARQVQWLIDDEARLREYQILARQGKRRVRVSIEIDIGMHRGGVSNVDELMTLLSIIDADPDHLEFAGFMGYDAHVPKAPRWTSPAAALAQANACYADFVDAARSRFPALWHDGVCLNGAGSPSFGLHGSDSPLNELAIGSALVKPTDFDRPTLAEVRPAALIATPILKRSAQVRLPYLERIAPLRSPRRASVFLYGGRWMARPVWPRGLREDPLYGHSSNQQMMTLPQGASAQPGDIALLRPTQSEAVLLQFGDLLALRNGDMAARWAIDPV